MSLHLILHLQRRILLALLVLASTLSGQYASAHGGVAFQEDLCVINIDFLQAHFTVFQPETRESDEFCEDIPDISRSVFVMEYLHSLLPEMLIDFRIIRDINEVGQYATLEDVLAIEDLEAATVYYEPPRIEPGGFYTASYEFDSKGTYIGIVTADHPTEDRYYTAVFYFQVGGPDYGTLPLFLALFLVLQTGYWLSNGGWAKHKARLAVKNQTS
jgi:hypothetical protein|tara:strand:- start:155 stop:799 length:645 start_codon:yes stop_codon:yes gene_type:complete